MKKYLLENIVIFLIALAMLDGAAWFAILYPASVTETQLYFLDVGQGDSSLAILPASADSGQAGGVKLLIDGGPMNGRAQQQLEKILSLQDRYIDLIMVSHPQLDHFGGLLDVMRNYRVGAVLMSGFGAENQFWKEFEKLRIENKIPKVVLAEGDKIIYENSQFEILSPSVSASGKIVNDIGLAGILQSNGIKAFFGADLGAKMEKELAEKYDLNVDILKVSHHGSKYSSDAGFLKEASPLFSIIEVGKNSYGHPTKEALAKLRDAGSKIFRTDLNGLIKLVVDDGGLKIYTSK